jgi:drug/metabolite transporter (DMT)-like permease
MFLPGVVSLIVNLFRNPKRLSQKGWERCMPLLAIIFFSTLLPLILKAFALQRMPSSKFAMLCSIDPFVAAFWTCLFFGEELLARQVVALFMATMGVLLVLAEGVAYETGVRFFGIFAPIDLGVILSVFLGKLGWVLSQQMLRMQDFKSTELNSLVMTGAGTVAMFGSFVSGETTKLASLLEPKIFCCAFFTVLINTAGYFFFTESLRYHSFTLVSVVSCGIPIIVAVLGYLVYGEAISVVLMLAFLLNFLAVRLFTSSKKETAV